MKEKLKSYRENVQVRTAQDMFDDPDMNWSSPEMSYSRWMFSEFYTFWSGSGHKKRR